VDARANGAGSDRGTFNDTDLQRSLQENTIGVPPPEPLAQGEMTVPYYLLGDDAFALKQYLTKPLPLQNLTTEQRIFNYRLSRA